MEQHRSKRPRLEHEPEEPTLPLLGVNQLAAHGSASQHEAFTLNPIESQPKNQYGSITAKDNATVLNGDNYETHNHFYQASGQQVQTFSARHKFEALRESLAFTRMDARLRNVSKALPKTCNWLFNHNSFMDWQDQTKSAQHNGFLWIKGKPGCGKSTLMKTALAWANKNWPRSHLCISYFFNARAPESLEKSSLGLYRSLVHQLITSPVSAQCFQHLFMQTFTSKATGDAVEEWTTEELQDFLSDAVQIESCPHMCIFIDALDEGDEEDIRKMISFLEDLTSHANESPSTFRICLSSRHYPHITIRKGLSLIVEDQAAHDEDIELYVVDKLVTGTEPEALNLRDAICTKSKGIFLWVVLVVGILNQIHDHSNNTQAMFDRLTALPTGLEGLFREIVARDPTEKHRFAVILQWVLFATRPLSPLELYLAVETTAAEDSVVESFNFDGGVPKMAWLITYITTHARGLIELTKASPPACQFIHETAREFLLSADGLPKFTPGSDKNVVGAGNAILAKACLTYIRQPNLLVFMPSTFDIDTTAAGGPLRDPKSASKMYALLEYAVKNIFPHAYFAHGENADQQRVLCQLCSKGAASGSLFQHWKYLRNLFERFKIRRYEESVTPLYVLADYGMLNSPHDLAVLGGASPGGAFDEISTCINTESGRYGSALQVASFRGHNDTVRLLLSQGADVNLAGGEYASALTAAVAGQHLDIARVLVDHGAEIRANTIEPLVTKSKKGPLVRATTTKFFLDCSSSSTITYEAAGAIVLYFVRRNAIDSVVKFLDDCRTAFLQDFLQDFLLEGVESWVEERFISMSKYLHLIRCMRFRWSTGHVTLLNLAARKRFNRAIQAFYDVSSLSGAVSSEDLTEILSAALCEAADAGQVSTVRLLLRLGAEKTFVLLVREHLKTDALGAAVYSNDIKMVRTLLDEGAEPDGQMVLGAMNALEVTYKYGGRNLRIRSMLLAKCSPIDYQEGDLERRCRSRDLLGVAKTIDQHRQAITWKEAVAALHAAIDTNNSLSLDLLLEHPLLESEIDAAFRRSAALGFYTTTKTLLDHGADVNSCGHDERTALYTATANNREYMVSLLKERGGLMYPPGDERNEDSELQNRNGTDP